MNYTADQIERAKIAYNNMLVIRTVESYDPQYIGYAAANQRSEYNNKIVTAILAGDKELEKEWKMFFLNEVVKSDKKSAESKAKKTANKEASSDILATIKEAKKMVEFGKWLNVKGNPYRTEHFNKKYTIESVNEFLKTL
jgi:hypothetical protein